MEPYLNQISCHIFFSDLCQGMAMVAYIKPQQRKKEESKRLRGERDRIKFMIKSDSCILIV